MAIEKQKFFNFENRVQLPFRVLSGIIGALSLLILLIILIFERPLSWEAVILLSFGALLFLPVGLKGRAPKWFVCLFQRV